MFVTLVRVNKQETKFFVGKGDSKVSDLRANIAKEFKLTPQEAKNIFLSKVCCFACCDFVCISGVCMYYVRVCACLCIYVCVCGGLCVDVYGCFVCFEACDGVQ